MSHAIIDMFYLDGCDSIYSCSIAIINAAFAELTSVSKACPPKGGLADLSSDLFERPDAHTIRVRPDRLATFADCRRRYKKHVARFP